MSELDEFLQELDEDVEGMQSTILFLQQELRASRERTEVLEAEVGSLRLRGAAGRNAALTNGSTAEDYDSEPALIIKVSQRERIYDDEDSQDSTNPTSEKDKSYNVNGMDESKSGRTNCESGFEKKRNYESDWSECSTAARSKKQRRASVLSLDYNEDEDPLTAPNGDANC